MASGKGVGEMKSKGLCSEVWPTETSKIRDKIMPFLECRKSVLDVGCGREKVVPWAIGVDICGYDPVTVQLENQEAIYDLDKIIPEKVEAVFSSHFLEHTNSWTRALVAMIKCLAEDGVLVLYLPEDSAYDNDSNPSHLHKFTYECFLQDMKCFKNVEVIAHGLDIKLPERYSFYVVLQKTG